MKYTVVTTFNDNGYNRYGRRMIQTFLQTWPKEVNLVVYAEGCTVTETASNLTVKELHLKISGAVFQKPTAMLVLTLCVIKEKMQAKGLSGTL